MIGQVFSHYAIREKFGEGGMGVVYRAEDSLLNRQVAVKVLSAKTTSDPSAASDFFPLSSRFWWIEIQRF